MKSETEELIETERRRDNFSYIAEVIQRGRIKPATFIHEFQMPACLFEEMKDKKLIDVVYLVRREKDGRGKTHDPIAFFDFKPDVVNVSFHHIFNRQDFKAMVDRYLIIKAYGYYPCKANWVSKMNFDKSTEPVQHVFNKKIKGNDNIITLKSSL